MRKWRWREEKEEVEEEEEVEKKTNEQEEEEEEDVEEKGNAYSWSKYPQCSQVRGWQCKPVQAFPRGRCGV